MKKLVYVLTVFLLVASCASQEKTTTSTSVSTEVKEDSTYTTKRFVPVDTLITIPEQREKFNFNFDDISDIPVSKSQGNTTAKVSLINNRLEIECLQEEYERMFRYEKEISASWRQIAITQKEHIDTLTVIKVTPWYFRTTTYMIAGFILGVLYVALKIFKII